MADTYTIDATSFFSILGTSSILDRASSFPPVSKYRIVISPDPGKTIQASQCSVDGMSFSYKEDSNSQTRWPSRFQWTMPGLGELDNSTLSGFKEFPVFYKIVFEDSTNVDNNPYWNIDDYSNENLVYGWIYIGKNEKTPINTLFELYTSIYINKDSTLITQNKITDTTIDTTNNITSFNF